MRDEIKDEFMEELNKLRSKLKKKEEQVESLEEKLKLHESIFNSIPDVLGIQDRNYRIICYNQAGYDFLGRGPEEANGKFCFELIGCDRPCEKCATKIACETGDAVSIEKFVVPFEKWIEVRAYPVFDNNGNIDKVIEHLRDITEKKVTEKELDGYRKHLEYLVKKRTSDLEKVNRDLIKEIAARKEAELKLQEKLEFENLISTLSSIFINLPVAEIDFEIERSLKAIFDFLEVERGSLFEPSDNENKFKITHTAKVEGISSMPFIDIDSHFPWCIEQILENKIVYFSDLEELPQEAEIDKESYIKIGNKSTIVVPLKDRGNIIGALSFSTLTRHKIWTESLINRIKIAGHIFSSVIMRKKASEVLKKERDTAQKYLDIAGVIIVAIDNKGEITLINKKGCQVLGYEEEYIKGLNWFDNFIPERMGAKLKEGFLRIIQGNSIPLDYYENPVLTKTGEERLIAWHNSVLKDKTGNIKGTLSSGEDITEKKLVEKEKEKLELQLRQSQKREAIGTLAGGIAHDFNNILGAIMGYTELAMDDISSETLVYENLQRSLQSTHRAKDLIKQILTFSRQPGAGRRPVIVSYLVREALRMIRATIPSTIDIEEDIGAISSVVLAEPTQIHQILINLCTNASHAMEEKGGVMKVSLTEVEGKNLSFFSPIISDLYIKLSVSDSGYGMTAETMERIFDPYFTTKKFGEGTGLGLSVVHGIVKSYSGEIKVFSDPGKGSRFDIYIPVIEGEEIEKSENTMTVPSGKGEKVLVIDDEKVLVDIMKEILKKLNYEVFSFTDSKEAFLFFRDNPDNIDIVVTDQTMPELTGLELAGKIMAIRPDIPVILCTGYSKQVRRIDLKAAGIRELLMKPVVRIEIAEAIRRELNK